jgi:hypothetical protein
VIYFIPYPCVLCHLLLAVLEEDEKFDCFFDIHLNLLRRPVDVPYNRNLLYSFVAETDWRNIIIIIIIISHDFLHWTYDAHGA